MTTYTPDEAGARGTPCGGCGAAENSKRCIGCLHDFGTEDSAWVRKYHNTFAASQAEPKAEVGEGLVERVARAIAAGLGDSFDSAFVNKSEWIAARGEKGGRYRDVNEPRQSDYMDAARAAISAMPDPSTIRREAFEEAARVADDDARGNYLKPPADEDRFSEAQAIASRVTARRIAAAIRALAQEQAVDD